MSQWNDANRIGVEVEIPDYVVTEEELSAQSYATQTYVANYVDEHGGSGGSIDLSSYVSYSYLESKHYLDSVPNDYPTYAAISEMGYITASDVPTPDLSTYVSKNELSSQSYVTDTALENAGYLTYIISRDIRPDTTGRWNFGSVDYVWDSTYQRNNYLGTKARIYGTNSYEIWVGFGTGTYYYVNRTRIQPNGTTQADLGSSNNNWQNTYTKKLYLNNTDIETRLSSYVSKTDLSSQSYVTTTALDNASYASQTYVADYVAEHGSSVDLSSYVSKDELSAQSYVSQSQLDTAGYITSIPSEYITENDLSACGYITIDDVSQMGYITSGDVPVIDESIIPNTTNTYTLGDSNHLYFRAYTARISGDTSGLWIDTNTNHRYYAGSTALRPYTNNQYTLGTSEYSWKDTYSYNLWLGTDKIYADEYALDFKINGNTSFRMFPASFRAWTDNSCDLGNSSNNWRSTYTKNLFLNNIDVNEVFPSYSYVSDNYLSLHGDRVMDGTLTLGNAVPAILGTEKSWKIYEGGTGSGAYIALQNNVNSKSFFIRSESNQNLVQILGSGSTASKHYLHSALQASYVNCYQYIKNVGNYNGSNGTPDVNDVASVWKSSYSVSKLHYGTAVHDRTSYTVTATVDDFETDSNGNPLVGTTICVKLTSITGTNPSTLYPIKFIVNGKELPRWYANAAVTANGRNWYRDMNDGTNRYWYWFFDGTYWVWQGISEERDTTYSAMSDAEAAAGTSTTSRVIKPVTLATYYVAKSCFVFDSSTNTLTITTT